MILSYKDFFDRDAGRQQIEAEITTDHPASSYGLPVIVLEDGGSLDVMSWVIMDYQVMRATKKELAELQRMGMT